jgi:hypothetical protein
MIFYRVIPHEIIFSFRSLTFVCMYDKVEIRFVDTSWEYAGQVQIWLWSVDFWEWTLKKNRNFQFLFIISAMFAHIEFKFDLWMHHRIT